MPIEDFYDGNGATRDRVVTFPYTARAFVIVKVGGVLQVDGTDYVFFSDTVIRFDVSHIPPSGTDNIHFERVTGTSPLIDFVAGASILDSDLDTSIQQMTHLSEEQASEAYVAAQLAATVITSDVVVSTEGAALIDDTSFAAMRSTLGSGSKGDAIFLDTTTAAVLTELDMSANVRSFVGAADYAAMKALLALDADIPGANLLINGDFQIWQNGTALTGSAPINDDDTYFADQWVYLVNAGDGSDRTDIVKNVPTGDFTGVKGTARLTVNSGADNVKFGIFQPLENRDSQYLRGDTVTISFQAFKTGNLTDLRFHLMSFSGGSPDVIDTDIINAWNGGTTVPDAAGGVTMVEPTVADAEEITMTTAVLTFSATFVVPNDANNLGVFICTDDGGFAAGDKFQISGIKMETGSVATPYVSQMLQDELARCERFFTKTFDLETFPVEQAGLDSGELVLYGQDHAGAGNIASTYWQFPSRMLTTPTVVTYNPVSANANWRFTNYSDGSGSDEDVLVHSVGERGVALASIQSATNTVIFHIHASADARL